MYYVVKSVDSLSPELEQLVRRIVREETTELAIKRIEFENLKKAVLDLIEATKKSEDRLSRVENAVAELAEAQKRTEERLNELAEAQKRSEERITRLENAVGELTVAVKSLATSVGRLSDVVGFGLEDIAKVMAPGWLERHEKIFVDELERKIFSVGDEEIEIDLYGEGVKNGETIYIVGECKSRIYDSEVRKFVKTLKKLKGKVLPNNAKIYALMFGYWIHPRAEDEAKKHNIKLLASYMR